MLKTFEEAIYLMGDLLEKGKNGEAKKMAQVIP